MDDCTRWLRTQDGQFTAVAHNQGYVDQDGSPTEALREMIETRGHSVLEDAYRQSYRDMGVACFSETPDNMLLWSHYGGAHHGICLEFDTTSPLLNKLHKVVYTDDIPRLNIVDVLLGDTARVLTGLLTKASCWAYEQEWRAIHKKGETLYCYGAEPLTGVYLGANLSDAEIDLVCHTLHGGPTQLYQMRRSDSSFRLHAEPVSYTPYQYPSPEST
jgi:hypothetical protein